MPAMNRFIVRADASHSIGLGHVMRSVAYADAARQRGIDTLFVVSTEGLGAELVSRRGFDVLGVSNAEDRSWAHVLAAGDVVLFDGYHFSAETLRASAFPGVLTAVMDDAVRAGHVDVVICPECVTAPEGLPATCTAICGIAYAPIRSEFSSRRRPRGNTAERGPLVVILGGTDTTGLTSAIVQAAERHRSGPFSIIQAVVGPGAIDWEHADIGSDVLLVRDPPALHELFDGAVAAISSAGTTAWELYCMGVPTAVIEVGPAQTVAARQALAAGATMYLGAGTAALDAIPHAISALGSPLVRRRLSTAALGFVDGRGADRVIDELDRRIQSICRPLSGPSGHGQQ
jgi:spore coat polysaccharide biosynthesis predicted glycosyltransferase SpsG